MCSITFDLLSTLVNLTELYLDLADIDLEMTGPARPVPMYSMRTLSLGNSGFNGRVTPIISYYRLIAELVPNVQELTLDLGFKVKISPF